MDIIKAVKDKVDKMLSDNSGIVPGTWAVPSDLAYLGIERYDTDNRCVIDLNPACRVFIAGCEVTKDVISVEMTNSMESGGSCTITLANPRGRYCISRSDLRKKWREDKDILYFYDYEWYQQRERIGFNVDSILEKVGGASLVQTVKSAVSIGKQAWNLVSSSTSPIPSVKGVTRVIFELKHFSGFNKYVNDTVFDYRDTVHVFMKGRFSNFWYFAFTGTISGISETSTYPVQDTITLTCTDVLATLQRSQINDRNAILSAANMEMRFTNSSSSRTFAISDTILNEPGLWNATKAIIFGPDYMLVSQSSYLSNGNLTSIRSKIFQEPNITQQPTGDPKGSDPYTDAKKALINQYSLDEMFMFTRKKPGTSGSSGVWGAVKSAATAVVNYITGSSNIETLVDVQSVFGTDVEAYPLSPFSLVYFQYNEINMPSLLNIDAKKDCLSVEQFYNLSVRFWNYGSLVLDSKTNLPRYIKSPEKIEGTGWFSNKCFGVAGIHPALTFEFVNNFNIGELVWEQCYIGGTKAIDNLVISPIEKVRESVFGSPVEFRDANNSELKGININMFRPRLFLLLPKRYRQERAAVAGLFGNFSLSAANPTSILDALKKLAQSVEYCVYSSPMGDVFIEPILYDAHPLDFHKKADTQDIYYAKTDIQVSEFGEVGKDKQNSLKTLTAFAYNSKASHPYFIMEKDRITITRQLKPEHLKTSVIVSGGRTVSGYAPLEAALKESDDFLRTMMALDSQGGSTSVLGYQAYVADGFPPDLFSKIGTVYLQKKEKYEKLAVSYKQVYLPLAFFNKYKDQTIQQLLDDVISRLDSYDKNVKEWRYLSYSSLLGGTTIDNWKKLSKDKKERIILNSDLGLPLNSILQSTPNKGAVYTKSTPISTVLAISSDTTLNSESMPRYLRSDSLEITLAGSYTRKDIFKSFLALSEFSLLFEDSGLLSIKEELAEGLPDVLTKPTTLKDLKEFAKLGLYAPYKDFVRMYGYNSGPKIENLFIKSGEEGLQYAEIVFKRYLGMASQCSTTIIGRPELFLNRPVFVEARDIIGTVSEYTLGFRVPDAFTSNVQLMYIRHNIIQHEYGRDKDLSYITQSSTKKLIEAEKKYFDSIGFGHSSSSPVASALKAASRAVLPVATQAGVLFATGKLLGAPSDSMKYQKRYVKNATAIISGWQNSSKVLGMLTSVLPGADGSSLSFRFTRNLQTIGYLDGFHNSFISTLHIDSNLTGLLDKDNAIVLVSNQSETVKITKIKNDSVVEITPKLLYSYKKSTVQIQNNLGFTYQPVFPLYSNYTYITLSNDNGTISDLRKKTTLVFSKNNHDTVNIKKVTSYGVFLSNPLDNTYVYSSSAPYQLYDNNNTYYSCISSLTKGSTFIPVNLSNTSLPRQLAFVFSRVKTESFKLGAVIGTKVNINENPLLEYPHLKSKKGVSYIENLLGERYYLKEDISVTGLNYFYITPRDLEQKLTLVLTEGSTQVILRVAGVEGQTVRLESPLLYSFTTSCTVTDNQASPVTYQLLEDANIGSLTIRLVDTSNLINLTTVTLYSVFEEEAQFNGWADSTSFYIQSPLIDSYDGQITDKDSHVYDLASPVSAGSNLIRINTTGDYQFLCDITTLNLDLQVTETTTVKSVGVEGSEYYIQIHTPLRYSYPAGYVFSDSQDSPETYTLSQNYEPSGTILYTSSYKDLDNLLTLHISGENESTYVVSNVVVSGTQSTITLTSSTNCPYPDDTVVYRIDSTIEVKQGSDIIKSSTGRITSNSDDPLGIIYQTKEAFNSLAHLNVTSNWSSPFDKTRPVEPVYSETWVQFTGGVTVPERRVTNKKSVLIGAPLAQLAGEKVKKLLQPSISGGLFSVHPPIGHINYDDTPFTYESVEIVEGQFETFSKVINSITETITTFKNQYISIGDEKKDGSKLKTASDNREKVQKELDDLKAKIDNPEKGADINQLVKQYNQKMGQLQGYISQINSYKRTRESICMRLYGSINYLSGENSEPSPESYFGQLLSVLSKYDSKSTWVRKENENDTSKEKLTFVVNVTDSKTNKTVEKSFTIETYATRQKGGGK